MKYFLCVVLFLLSIQLAFSQSHWGVKIGFNNSVLAQDSYSLEDLNEYDDLKLKLKDADFNFHFGLLYHFELAKRLFFQPEFLIISSKYQYSLNDDSQIDFIDKILDEKFTYLDVPIQIGLRIHPFQFGMGVVPQILLKTVSEIGNIHDLETDTNKVSLAYTAGIGMDVFKTIKLELRYENSEELLGRKIVIDNENYNFETRASQFLISASIIF